MPASGLKLLTLLILLGALTWGRSLSAQAEFQVYVFVAEECPISIAMAAPLRAVSEKYGGQADFVAVFPNLKSDEISMRAFLGRYDLKAYQPVLDEGQAISRSLTASVTPEVIVTDVAGTVVYRGRITDAYSSPGRVRHGKANNDLEAALRTLVQGGRVAQPWPEAVGCFITFLEQPE